MRIDQFIRLRNDINFSETPSISHLILFDNNNNDNNNNNNNNSGDHPNDSIVENCQNT